MVDTKSNKNMGDTCCIESWTVILIKLWLNDENIKVNTYNNVKHCLTLFILIIMVNFIYHSLISKCNAM